MSRSVASIIRFVEYEVDCTVLVRCSGRLEYEE